MKQLNLSKNNRLCEIFSFYPHNSFSSYSRLKNQKPHNPSCYENQKTSRHQKRIESIHSSPNSLFSRELSLCHMSDGSLDKLYSQSLYICLPKPVPLQYPFSTTFQSACQKISVNCLISQLPKMVILNGGKQETGSKA